MCGLWILYDLYSLVPKKCCELIEWMYFLLVFYRRYFFLYYYINTIRELRVDMLNQVLHTVNSLHNSGNTTVTLMQITTANVMPRVGNCLSLSLIIVYGMTHDYGNL